MARARGTCGSEKSRLLVLVTIGCPDEVVDPEEPTIALSRAIVSFTSQQGTTPPAPATLGITNSKDGALSGFNATATYRSGASGWLTVSMSSGTGPYSLVLTVTTTGLEPGTHRAMVSVSSGVAMNSPRSATVT